MPPESSSLEERIRGLEERIRVLEEKLAASHSPAETRRTHLRAPPAGGAGGLEVRVGAYWLSRVGIVAFITGVAFLVIYKFGELGIALRIAAGYGVGAGLAGLGHLVSRRHRVFGEVLFGGGVAVAYFVTYALRFVPAVRVIESDYVALALLGSAVVAVVWTAHRMRSETVAGIALFLGLHTGMLSDVTALTLLSTCLLAAGAVLFLVTHRWVVVPVSGLAAAYVTHARWMIAGSEGGGRTLSLGFLAVYFSLFAAALLLRPAALQLRGRIALPLANAAGLVALGWWELRGDSGAVAAFLAMVALAHAGLAAASHARARELRELVEVHLGVALATAALASWVRLQGLPLGAALAALALAAGMAARLRRSPALAWVGFMVLALTGTRLLALDLRRLGPDLRIATFLLLGGLLLGVSFVYARRPGGARERS